MVDREKVIMGLECCAREDIGDCNNCPYDSGNGPRCDIEMMRDALALLKAQEPRVMTLEEAQKSLMIEYRSGKTRNVGAELFGEFGYAYNIIWRVWTSRPTDEQREATPWE